MHNLVLNKTLKINNGDCYCTSYNPPLFQIISMLYPVTWNPGLFRAHHENNRFRSDVLKGETWLQLRICGADWILGYCGEWQDQGTRKLKGSKGHAFLTAPLTIGEMQVQRVSLSSSHNELEAQMGLQRGSPDPQPKLSQSVRLSSRHLPTRAWQVVTCGHWIKVSYADQTFHPSCLTTYLTFCHFWRLVPLDYEDF